MLIGLIQDGGQVHVLAGTAPDASRVAYMRTVRPSGDYDPNQVM